MRNHPLPLTWPAVVPLEMARRKTDQALLALDLAFQRQVAPEALTEALHAAARATAYESHLHQEAPGWN